MEYLPSYTDQLYHSYEPSWRDSIDGAELYHHGIKGMKWGVRRYQNPDGSLTAAGKKRQKKLLNRAESTRREAKNYRRAADEYEKYIKDHPKTGFMIQPLADKSRAYATQADRDAKHIAAKATFDKDKIRKANKDWWLETIKDNAVGPTAKETYKRNRKAGKGRITSAAKGIVSESVVRGVPVSMTYTYNKRK